MMATLLRPSHHQSLAGDEGIARQMTAAGAALTTCRAWPQLRYIGMTFAHHGETLLPSLASDLVIATPPTTITFVRRAAPPCRFTWHAGDRAMLVSLDTSVVAWAAVEAGMRGPVPGDRPASIMTRDHVCTHLLCVLTEEARVPLHAMQTPLVESVASALAVRLIAQFAVMPATAMAPVTGELTTHRFVRVLDYIEHHLGDAISLEDLARVAGVSRFHFARQFRARTGESPMGYLMRTRVERAKTRLRNPRTRVIDIAAELGFADQSHFARTFRRLVGMPPSAYARAAVRL